MDWKEVHIHTTHEAMEPISYILNEHGANGVLIKDSNDLIKKKSTRFGEVYELDKQKFPEEGIFIKAYFVDEKNFQANYESIMTKINDLRQFDIDIGTGELIVNNVIESEWETAWKNYYKPTPITDNITIVPSWEKYERKHKDELIVKLDPGMAFGTGTHETTMLSVKALQKYVKEKDIVIDVGCGSGILSITSILLGATKVYAYDLDQVAVRSTAINSELNDVQDKIIVMENDLLKGIDIKSDVIVSNILAEILIDLIDDAYTSLVDDGYFILSGIIEQKELLVKERLEKAGFKIIERNEMEHWISFVAQKRI